MEWIRGGNALFIVTFSLKPKIIYGRSGRRELQVHLLIASLCLPVQGFFNSTIAQFGVLIEDEAICSVFRSRLKPKALIAYNENLVHFKTEIAPNIGKIEQSQLLEVVHDKIHEEALVHAFRRFYHFRRGNTPVVYKENLILRKYFKQFITGTALDWPKSKSVELHNKIGDLAYSTYYSPVAEHLITKFSEMQMWIVILLLDSLLLIWFFKT